MLKFKFTFIVILSALTSCLSQTIPIEEKSTIELKPSKNKVDQVKNIQLKSKEILESELKTNSRIILANFNPGSSKPNLTYTPEAYNYLSTILNEGPLYGYTLIGHTNSQGSNKANLNLSWRRAKNFKKVLVKSYGVKQNKIECFGKGEVDPIDSNESETGRYNNSRIEIKKNDY